MLVAEGDSFTLLLFPLWLGHYSTSLWTALPFQGVPYLFSGLSAAVVLAPDRNSIVNPTQLSPHIKTMNQNHVTCWQVSVERVGIESRGSRGWALGSTSAALHSQSIWFCHQKWDPKGAIQGTHFLERELLGKPQLSVQVWWCSTYVCGVENGWCEVLEAESVYLEQKRKQRCDGIGWKTSIVHLFLPADQHKKELRKRMDCSCSVE